MSDEEERLVGFDVATAMAGVCRAEIHRRIKKGEFPIPVRDGPYRNSRTLFSLRELRDYVAAKLFTTEHSVISRELASDVEFPAIVSWNIGQGIKLRDLKCLTSPQRSTKKRVKS